MSIRLLEDIRNQPESLRAALNHHLGEGRDALILAAQAMRESRRLVISGMGASFYAAMPLQYSFPDAQLVATSDLLHYRRNLCRDATVMLVSRSGETVEALKMLPVLKQLGAVVIGVTNEGGSTLARESDHTILTSSGRDQMVAIQTYTGTLLTLLLLAAAEQGELLDVRGEASDAIRVLEELVKTGESAPPPDFSTTVYVLGRGPSMASANEGALLFHETAKFPAIALEAGGFRHGPVEVVDEHFRAIVFAGQPATRDLDVGLAADLTGFGGQVQVIAIEGVAPRFVPLAEIVPVQFAALRLAQARGIQPGKFRYVTQVTNSETGFALRPGN